MRQYTFTEYLYTGGRRNPNVDNALDAIQAELQKRALQYQLQKSK